MSNKIRVLSNITASKDIIVDGNTVISGSKQLNTNAGFNNSTVATSSDGFYNIDLAIHGLDSGITNLRNIIKSAYDSTRAVLTGSLDSDGNKKINLTTTIPSGNVFFTTASLTDVEASVMIDTDNDSVYKDDLVSLQLYNSSSYLWAEIDAPAAQNDPYRLIVSNQASFTLVGFNTPNNIIIDNINWTLSGGLVAYYKFEGNANDEFGNYNGTATAHVTYGGDSGIDGQGLSTNNLSYKNYIDLNSEIPLTGHDWTISFWMKPHDTGNWRALFGKQGDVALYFLNNKFYLENLFSGGGHTFNTAVQSNVWQHVVLTYDNTAKQHNLYINNTIDSSPANNIGPFNIKQIAADGVGDESYYGAMDEFAVWDRILTLDEVKTLYNGGFGFGFDIVHYGYAPLYNNYVFNTDDTGNVNTYTRNAHKGFYIFPDLNGNVVITLNNLSSSTNTGMLAIYTVNGSQYNASGSQSGSVQYDPTTNIVSDNGYTNLVTLHGVNGNVTAAGNNVINSGGNVYISGSNITSSVITNGSPTQITLSVGTGSTVYVDGYSDNNPAIFNIGWSGGIYTPSSGSGVNNTLFVPTTNGGYWIPRRAPLTDYGNLFAGIINPSSSDTCVTGSSGEIAIPFAAYDSQTGNYYNYGLLQGKFHWQMSLPQPISQSSIVSIIIDNWMGPGVRFFKSTDPYNVNDYGNVVSGNATAVFDTATLHPNGVYPTGFSVSLASNEYLSIVSYDFSQVSLSSDQTAALEANMHGKGKIKWQNN